LIQINGAVARETSSGCADGNPCSGHAMKTRVRVDGRANQQHACVARENGGDPADFLDRDEMLRGRARCISEATR
jgi:hypothetical protein